MADIDWSKLKSNKFSNAVTNGIGLAGVLGTAMTNVPKADNNNRYLNQAAIVGNWDYGASDMNGLMSQYANTPALSHITGRDLYNPSKQAMFASMFGTGMAAYGAASGMTDGLFSTNKKSKTIASDDSGLGKEVTLNQNPNAFDWNTYASAPEAYSAIASGIKTNSYQTTSNVNQSTNQDYTQKYEQYPTQTITGLKTEPISTSMAKHVNYNTPKNQKELSFNPSSYTFANGGHLFWDGGNAISTGLNLAAAGLGLGLSYAGIKRQQQIADAEAAQVNYANDYARQLSDHNFNSAVKDTKNNMFNQQALQMMAEGGDLQTQGSEFPLNGNYNVIGAGGTHEQNPNNGVYQGMAEDGRPNLVEENEVVWNDYVFSNRLTVPKKFAKQNKLKENLTYAEAAQKMIEEAKERPNDPISQNGIASSLSDLRDNQEETRQKKEAERLKRQISNMSPEEMQAFAAVLQQLQGQGRELQMPQQTPQEEMMTQQTGQEQTSQETSEEEIPQEEVIAANGGKLFKRGGSKNEREQQEKFDFLLNQLAGNERMLNAVASRINGYNADNYKNTNATEDLKSFITNAIRSGENPYDALLNLIRTGSSVSYVDPNDNRLKYNYNYKEREEWADKFDKYIKGYKGSLNEAITKGKYAIAKADNSTNEQLADYQAFWDYVLDHAENYDDSNTDWVRQHLRNLDNGVNKKQGVELLYDDKGKLKSNWKDLVRKRIADQKAGIYHEYGIMPKVKGIRTIVEDENGNILDMNPENLNAFYTKLKEYDTDDATDAEGNARSTKHIVVRKNDYGADYEEPEPVQGLPTYMRYAPVLGNVVGALSDDNRDYSTAVSPNVVQYAPIGDYLAYNPVDTQRYVNTENQQNRAQLDAIMNATSGNRNMAMAQAALANNQRIEDIGKLLSGAENINFDRRKQVGDFNKATNQFNAQSFNAAEQANANNDQFLYNQAEANAEARHKVDMANDAAKSANLTSLFNNLGAIGNENLAWNQANSNMALDYGVSTNPFMQGISAYRALQKKQAATNGNNTSATSGNTAAFGRRLTRKNRR